jgi:hypothetical protein
MGRGIDLKELATLLKIHVGRYNSAKYYSLLPDYVRNAIIGGIVDKLNLLNYLPSYLM